jgi:uncharacterized protein YndB with AHSA1/START domain
LNTPKTTIAVEVKHTYIARPQEVYNAWLDKDLVQQWFGPGLGETKPVQLDAREGGTFRIVQVREGQPVGHSGTYLQLQPPGFISFTWSMDDVTGADVVSVNIKETAAGSLVTVTHEIDEQWKDYADSVRTAWLTMMQKMDTLLLP